MARYAIAVFEIEENLDDGKKFDAMSSLDREGLTYYGHLELTDEPEDNDTRLLWYDGELEVL